MKAKRFMENAIHGWFLLMGLVTVGCVLLITVYLIISGIPAIREIGLVKFLFGPVWDSNAAEPQFGILSFILTSVYGTAGAILLGVPVGFMTAVFLAKMAPPKLKTAVSAAVSLLAGIPSVVYGLVGMLVFSQALGFQTCLLSGSLTLVVMNLPTIIRTTQESLKTVPQGYREGALGLGAGKWHIIRTIVLPCSIDGIVTGCILAVGRIVGESAALLFTAGAAEVIAGSIAKAYTSNGATLSVLLYLRAFEDGDFASAWGIGAVLLVLVLLIDLAARLAKTKLKQKQ